MKRLFWKLPLLFLVLPLLVEAADSSLAGRWRLDPPRSTALDGWTAWDLVIDLEGSRVTMQNDMEWRATKFSATNTFSTDRQTEVKEFFRVEQRHMALYSIPGAVTPVRAEWLDADRTLRVEARVPVEGSQGTQPMRIYQEYRLVEGDQQLILIELHSTRGLPLVYRFNKVLGKK